MSVAPELDVLGTLRTLIGETLHLSPDEIRPEQSLTELGLSSLERIELGLQLEDALQLVLSEEDLVRVQTVGDLVELIAAKRAVAR